MSFKDKVDHIKHELDMFLQEDNQKVVANSMYRVDG